MKDNPQLPMKIAAQQVGMNYPRASSIWREYRMSYTESFTERVQQERQQAMIQEQTQAQAQKQVQTKAQESVPRDSSYSGAQDPFVAPLCPREVTLLSFDREARKFKNQDKQHSRRIGKTTSTFKKFIVRIEKLRSYRIAHESSEKNQGP